VWNFLVIWIAFWERKRIRKKLERNMRQKVFKRYRELNGRWNRDLSAELKISSTEIPAIF